jgi:hypothetical protein
MNAALSPLRSGPFAALVQRRYRKAHLASVADGAPAIATFCDRLLPAAETTVSHIDSPADAALADDVCAHCYRMALVALLVQGGRPEASVPDARRSGPLTEWIDWYGVKDGIRLHEAAVGGTP